MWLRGMTEKKVMWKGTIWDRLWWEWLQENRGNLSATSASTLPGRRWKWSQQCRRLARTSLGAEKKGNRESDGPWIAFGNGKRILEKIREGARNNLHGCKSKSRSRPKKESNSSEMYVSIRSPWPHLKPLIWEKVFLCFLCFFFCPLKNTLLKCLRHNFLFLVTSFLLFGTMVP